MNKHATVADQRQRWAPASAENMMSGVVHVEGDASQSAGATGRGGLLVHRRQCLVALRHLDEGHRHRGARARSGTCRAFMAQAGNLVVLGDAGDALGDSIYEARLFVRGRVKSLGADCIEKPMRRRAQAGAA